MAVAADGLDACGSTQRAEEAWWPALRILPRRLGRATYDRGSVPCVLCWCAQALKRWGLAEGAVDALLTAADGDGDGRVSLSDFMCFMRAPGEDEEVMP